MTRLKICSIIGLLAIIIPTILMVTVLSPRLCQAHVTRGECIPGKALCFNCYHHRINLQLSLNVSNTLRSLTYDYYNDGKSCNVALQNLLHKEIEVYIYPDATVVTISSIHSWRTVGFIIISVASCITLFVLSQEIYSRWQNRNYSNLV